MQPCGHPQREKPIKDMKEFDNHKENKDGDGVSNFSSNPSSISSKLRAAVLGLTPAAVFKYTLVGSAIIALAATIIYHTASQSIHVRIDKVETSCVLLTGASDLGGIGLDGFTPVNYGITNQSTAPAYVFVRIEEATAGLYEVTDLDGWCRVTDAEGEGELIFGYGESGGLTPVGIGEEVVMSGRLHCLADAVMYSSLTGADMDIDVEA